LNVKKGGKQVKLAMKWEVESKMKYGKKKKLKEESAK
jgi:hypothetical protein